MTKGIEFFIYVVFQTLQLSSSTFNIGESELKDSKRALLQSLGLNHQPRIKSWRNDFFLRRYSAPKFMVNLFKKVNGEVFISRERFEFETKYLNDTQVDTIISFFKYDHDKSWNKISREFKIKFKARFNPHHDIIRGGELKIYKRLPRNHSMIHANCSVSVYLIDPESLIPQMIDTHELNTWQSGWQTFNITLAMKLWALYPLSNHGLKLVIHYHNEELSPRDFGIVGTRGNLEKRPYIVGFVGTTRDLNTFTPKHVAPSRERRAAQRYKYGNKLKTCELKKFRVNFKEIGLDETIIFPKSFKMFFCQGMCSHPMDSERTTNHATIQSIYHLHNDVVDEPCCVPGNLKSINILFYDNDGNIRIKMHPDMVATSCVCN